MSDNIEHLIREAESDIDHRNRQKSGTGKTRSQLPRASGAIIIWLVAILLAAFQFESVVAIFSEPGEYEIQSDLEGILITAAGSIRNYELRNGALPPLLPNPAIRGLVKYDRIDAVRFQLQATIGDVTVVLDSSNLHPQRQLGSQ